MWKTLKQQFHLGDQSQILTLMSQLQLLKLTKGGTVDEYLKKARELKNRLGNMGEKLSDRNVNQIVLNGLPRSYESTIQTLSYLNASMTFEQLSTSLMSESHKREHRNQKLGEDEALAATQTKQERLSNQGQGQGNHWQQSFRERGYPMRGSMGNYFFARRSSFRPPFTCRPPVICFNCGKPGHFTQDCRLLKQSQRDDNASEGTKLWTEAVATATYLINKSPTQANHGVPLDAQYFNKKPDVLNLQIFGCMAYVHIPKEHRQKLDSKTQRCLFLGYDDETKAYRLYDHIKKQVIISRNVIFDESKIGYQHLEITEFEDDSLDFPLTTGEGESMSCHEPAVTESIEVLTFQTPNETDHKSRVQVDNLNTSRPLHSIPMQSQNSPTTQLQHLLPVDPSAGPPARRYPSQT